MIQVLWEFVVQPQAVERFEQAYAPGGDWARLFSRFPGFRGTTLLRDVDTPRRYLTIDCWESCRHREEMLSQAQDDYARLDSSFADCMESEAEIGIFDVRG